DHSPAPGSMKCRGDFGRAWGGIASLQLSLPATWTAVSRDDDGADVRRALARWMSEGPAALAGLADRKGRLDVGCDADLVVWDPDAAFTVDAASLQHRHKLTPYAGRALRGRIVTTFVKGVRVWDGGLAAAPTGTLL